ncbi:MAG: hypothetical protein HC836_37145 [Richelia sp. RM2_1_2]|nr:hypothetical protein [Richelia sp. RM2_1_2]
MSNPHNRLDLAAFKELIAEHKRAAFNIFPFKHYFGMTSVEVIESTDEQEGGYKVWTVPAFGGDRSSEVFYPFSREADFNHDILQKLHPAPICACGKFTECFQ